MGERVKINILLVDDQPAKLLSLEAVLAELDENVLKASSADEALRLLLEHDVAVVLVDVCMPRMDGFELAELIRQHPRFHRTAIIFISAVHLSDDDRLRGYQLGAVDYIPVPIVPQVLRAKVAIFAELHRKNEQLYRLNHELEQRVAQRTADLEASAAQLRESEVRYRQLVHALPVAVYACDAEGRITLYNQAAVELWGREPEVGVERWCGSWRIYRFNGTLLPGEESPMAVAIRTGRIVRGAEIVVERPDGTRRTVVPYPDLIRDIAGNVIGAVNMLTDVTDTRRAEQAQTLLAEIVSSSADAIISISLDRNITSWNSGAERMFGYSAAEVIGRPILTLLPPGRAGEEDEIIARIHRGERLRSFETVRIAKDGRPVDVSLTVSPVRDSFGEVIGVSKVLRDIGEQKRAEAVLARDRETLERLVAERTRQLEQSVERLRIADRMATIGTLSAGLGHDMGNLLLPIRMHLDTIEASEVPPEVREDVQAIRKATEYLQRLAASLRLLAIDPEGGTELDCCTDLAQWWPEAEGMVRNGIPRSVSLQFDAGPGLPPVSMGKAALTQVVFNLVQNAGDAMKSLPNGRVTVAAEPGPAAGFVRIRVSDDGPGMSEEAQRRCLEPFFTTKTRGLSTGLGLALVNGLIKKAGGRIHVESAPQRGTTILLDIPAARRARLRDAGPGQPGRSIAAVTLNDPRLVAHVKSILRFIGYQISEAGPDTADLWVTEQNGEDVMIAAQDFVKARPVRRAVVFGGEAAGGDDGRITIVEKHLPPSVLRSRMYGLLTERT
ncbi:MAG: PAS domain S-box protein [Phycisphaerales bacterium]|nr:PAS domain S-box protein [Phycisphaerales bacterium]